MINGIEDITPGSFRGFNSNHDLNASPLEIDIDDDLYDYRFILFGKNTSNGASLPALMVNGSVPFTFTIGGTYARTTTQAAAFFGGPTGHGFRTDSATRIFIADWILNIKKGEGARVTQLISCSSGASSDEIHCENGINSGLVSTTITSLGIKDFFTNVHLDFHVRVFRWLRNAPVNNGDMLFKGAITADTSIDIDPSFLQSLGWVFQGTTPYNMDINNQEATNAYNHVAMGNTNSNSASGTSVIDRQDDVAEIETTHNIGMLNDVENSKRSIGVWGADEDTNPVLRFQKHSLATEDTDPVSNVEFLANGSLSGHLTFQRNIVYPFEFMPLHLLNRKKASSQDLSTALSLAVSENHYFGFIIRVMASADALETLQCAINNDFTSSYFNHRQYNGASKTQSVARAATSYLAQCEIGDGTEANYMQFFISGQKVEDEYVGLFHNLSKAGLYELFKIEYNDSADISSFDFKTTSASSITGVFEVFGVL